MDCRAPREGSRLNPIGDTNSSCGLKREATSRDRFNNREKQDRYLGSQSVFDNRGRQTHRVSGDSGSATLQAYFTGLLDIAGALLLLVPRWTCYGALVLACTIGRATVLNVLFSLHQNPLVPLMLTLLAATLAWLTRPRRGMLRGVTGI